MEQSVYMRCGKGPKQRLRFSRSGDPKVEEAYSCHFIWPGKGPFSGRPVAGTRAAPTMEPPDGSSADGA